MNAEHKANLFKLAEFLETNPNVQYHFDMESYVGQSPGCGTAGCALGWAPVALGLWDELPTFSVAEALERMGWTNFEDISLEYFGLPAAATHWDWIFSGEWGRIDNSPDGAAKRIRQVLEGKHTSEIHDFVEGYLEDADTSDAIERYEGLVP